MKVYTTSYLGQRSAVVTQSHTVLILPTLFNPSHSLTQWSSTRQVRVVILSWLLLSPEMIPSPSVAIEYLLLWVSLQTCIVTWCLIGLLCRACHNLPPQQTRLAYLHPPCLEYPSGLPPFPSLPGELRFCKTSLSFGTLDGNPATVDQANLWTLTFITL